MRLTRLQTCLCTAAPVTHMLEGKHQLHARMHGSRCRACAGDGASTPPQTPLTLKGLWDSLPLSLFLQVCGTSAAKNVISELNPDDDRPMGDSLAFQTFL